MFQKNEFITKLVWANALSILVVFSTMGMEKPSQAYDISKKTSARILFDITPSNGSKPKFVPKKIMPDERKQSRNKSKSSLTQTKQDTYRSKRLEELEEKFKEIEKIELTIEITNKADDSDSDHYDNDFELDLKNISKIIAVEKKTAENKAVKHNTTPLKKGTKVTCLPVGRSITLAHAIYDKNVVEVKRLLRDHEWLCKTHPLGIIYGDLLKEKQLTYPFNNKETFIAYQMPSVAVVQGMPLTKKALAEMTLLLVAGDTVKTNIIQTLQ